MKVGWPSSSYERRQSGPYLDTVSTYILSRTTANRFECCQLIQSVINANERWNHV